MRNLSYGYIEKYSPSKQQLKIYLLKKYLKFKSSGLNKTNINQLIDIVLEDLEKSKFINDKFYSNSKAKSLIQRGSSINKIRNYLLNKGIKDNFVNDTINKIKNDNDDQDFFSAIKICKKKELDQLEMKIIDLYLKKKILVYLQDLVSILIPQKESWM